MFSVLNTSDLRDVALLGGRCLLSAIFVMSAIDKFGAPLREIRMMKSLHVPFPRLVEYGVGVFEAACSLALILGFHVQLAALLLGAFLLVITVLLVQFWSETGQQQMNDRNTFFSNLSVVGGCLALAVAGPGQIALTE